MGFDIEGVDGARATPVLWDAGGTTADTFGASEAATSCGGSPGSVNTFYIKVKVGDESRNSWLRGVSSHCHCTATTGATATAACRCYCYLLLMAYLRSSRSDNWLWGRPCGKSDIWLW